MPAAAVAGILMFGASAAWATTTVQINGGNVPTTAAQTSHECSANQGGGPFVDKDVWVFILPGTHATSGDFVSLKATFDTDNNGSGDTTLTLPPATGGFLNGGPATSKAFLITSAGWTLVDASAVITGTASFFTLSHTCPASTTPTTPPPTPTPTPTVTPSTTATPTSSPSSSPGGSSSSGSASSPGVPSNSSTGGPGGPLPVTGVAVGTIAVVALGLIAGGTALVLARRRADQSTTL